MGGRFCSLDQTSVKIMQILSAQLNVDQKKRSSPKIETFFSSKSGEDQKNGLRRSFELYSAGICRIYSCWLAHFRLIMQRSNVDRGTLNLDGGTLTLDGGTCPPYNLSTERNHLSYDFSITIHQNLSSFYETKYF